MPKTVTMIMKELKEEAAKQGCSIEELVSRLNQQQEDTISRHDLGRMAECLMDAMLPEHIKAFARQLWEIDYKMPPHHFLMALILLAYEQGNFPMAQSMVDPTWATERLTEKVFVCQGCGEERPIQRLGQKFCSNECYAKWRREA